MYCENKEKTQNDDTSENEFQGEDIADNYETDTEENQESGDDEADLMIDQNLTNLSTKARPASLDVIKKNNRLYDAGKYTGAVYLVLL